MSATEERVARYAAAVESAWSEPAPIAQAIALSVMTAADADIRRAKIEALREAAEEYWNSRVDESLVGSARTQDWLRARADEIEAGR